MFSAHCQYHEGQTTSNTRSSLNTNLYRSPSASAPETPATVPVSRPGRWSRRTTSSLTLTRWWRACRRPRSRWSSPSLWAARRGQSLCQWSQWSQCCCQLSNPALLSDGSVLVNNLMIIDVRIDYYTKLFQVIFGAPIKFYSLRMKVAGIASSSSPLIRLCWAEEIFVGSNQNLLSSSPSSPGKSGVKIQVISISFTKIYWGWEEKRLIFSIKGLWLRDWLRIGCLQQIDTDELPLYCLQQHRNPGQEQRTLEQFKSYNLDKRTVIRVSFLPYSEKSLTVY